MEESELYDKIFISANQAEKIRDYLPRRFYTCIEDPHSGNIFYTEAENDSNKLFMSYGLDSIGCINDKQDFLELVDRLVETESCTAIVCSGSLYNILTSSSLWCKQNKEKTMAIVGRPERELEVYKVNL
jgi:hypothetical protein